MHRLLGEQGQDGRPDVAAANHWAATATEHEFAGHPAHVPATAASGSASALARAPRPAAKAGSAPLVVDVMAPEAVAPAFVRIFRAAVPASGSSPPLFLMKHACFS